jgi:putative flippase GtrA
MRSLLTRRTITQLVSYGINGVITAVVYTAVVWTLIALSRKTFALDVVAAYACAVVCNYVGARFIFKPTVGLRGHLPRYLAVIAGNFAVTALLAWSLHRAGVPNLFGAYLPVAVTAIPTFVLLRHWVFTPAPTEVTPADRPIGAH